MEICDVKRILEMCLKDSDHQVHGVTKIDEGGFGEVFLVRYRVLNFEKNEVFKIVNVSQIASVYRFKTVDEWEERLYQEVIFGEQLRGVPEIVRIEKSWKLDYFCNGIKQRFIIIAMERWDANISQIPVKERTVELARLICKTVSKALLEMNRQVPEGKFFHRDVKQENILYRKKDGKYEFALADLGIATTFMGKENPLQTNVVFDAWCLPDSNSQYRDKSDVFLLGMSIYSFMKGWQTGEVYRITKGIHKNIWDRDGRLRLECPKSLKGYTDFWNLLCCMLQREQDKRPSKRQVYSFFEEYERKVQPHRENWKRKRNVLTLLIFILLLVIVLKDTERFHVKKQETVSTLKECEEDEYEQSLNELSAFPPKDPDTETAEWSPWIDTLPVGVTEEYYEIEEKIQYSSRSKETLIQAEPASAEWALCEMEILPGEFGPWSEWSEEIPEDREDIKVEMKEEYRCCELQTVTSSAAFMEGWVQTDAITYWNDYGPWTEWQDEVVASTDSRRVETREISPFYYFFCGNCGRNARYPYWGYACEICGKKEVHLNSGTVQWFENNWDDSIYWAYNKYYQVIDNSIWWNWDDGQPKTQYRYSDRTQTTEYTYQKWSEWTDWSMEKYIETSERQVEKRKLYRYCQRGNICMYQYEKFSDWTDFSDEVISESETVEVQKRDMYRYKERVVEKE